MKNLIVLFLGIVVFLLSCDQVKTFEIPEEKLSYDQCVVPSDLSDIVSTTFVSDLFEVPIDGITLRQDVRSESKLLSFVLWDESLYVNNKGFYLAIQSNRNSEYEGNFVSDFVNVLKTVGESDVQGNRTLFIDWPDIGTDGAYSLSSRTFTWQIHNCILFKLIFNTSHDPEDQLNFATHLAHELNAQYFQYLQLQGIIK